MDLNDKKASDTIITIIVILGVIGCIYYIPKPSPPESINVYTEVDKYQTQEDWDNAREVKEFEDANPRSF